MAKLVNTESRIGIYPFIWGMFGRYLNRSLKLMSDPEMNNQIEKVRFSLLGIEYKKYSKEHNKTFVQACDFKTIENKDELISFLKKVKNKKIKLSSVQGLQLICDKSSKLELLPLGKIIYNETLSFVPIILPIGYSKIEIIGYGDDKIDPDKNLKKLMKYF